ncbi:hypothetical protein KAJ27_12825, partial [bacterium]|nr:hypothetical protein [bacterium]
MIIELWILFTGGSESPFTVFMIFPLAWIVYFSGFKPVEEFISVGFTIGIHMLSYSDEVKNIFITKLVTLIVIYLVMRLFFKSDNSNKQLPEVSENEEGFENKNLYSTTNKEYRKIKDFFENDKVLLSHKFYGDGDDVQKVERLRVVVKNYFLELYNSFKENHQDVENMMILIDDMKGNIFLFRREEGKINFQSFQLKFNFDQYDKKELSRELKRIIDFDEERLNYHSLQFEDETFGLVITEFQITPDELELIEKFSSDYYTSYILGKLRNMKQSIDYFEKERETYNFITELNAFESVDNIVKKIIGFIKYISKSDDAFFAVFKDSELNIISETGVKEDERKELLGIMKKYFIENQGNEKLKSYSLENEKSKVVVLPIKAFNKNDQDAAIGIFFRNGNLEFSYMNNIEKIMYHSSLLIDKYNLYKEYEQKVFTVKFLGLLFDLVKSKKIDKNIINMVLENILMFFPVSSCKLFMKNDTCFGEL